MVKCFAKSLERDSAIDADDRDGAETAVDKAQQALQIIRQMLPKSSVTTTVTNPAGDVLYEDTEEIQADTVTVYRSFAAVEVVRPLIASKKEAAEVEGDEFEGSALVEADVVIDLDFIDRRLGAAKRALSESLASVDDSLAEAQHDGTDLVIATIESPLAEAREALQFAHQAVTRKEYQAAEANLRIARGFLTLYREITPDAGKKDVDALNKEIDAMTQQITGTTTTNHESTKGAVKGLLDKVNSWWHGSNRTKPASNRASSKSPGPQSK